MPDNAVTAQPPKIESIIEDSLPGSGRSVAREAREPCGAHRIRGEREMNDYVLRSLVRAAAFRVMRRAPLWVAIAILAAGYIMEHGR